MKNKRVDVLEECLAEQMTGNGIAFGRQFRIPPRLYRFDFIILDLPKLLVEVQGGVWNRGAHVRGPGYERDCRKLAYAQLHGYRVLYVTGGMIRSGEALAMVKSFYDRRIK